MDNKDDEKKIFDDKIETEIEKNESGIEHTDEESIIPLTVISPIPAIEKDKVEEPSSKAPTPKPNKVSKPLLTAGITIVILGAILSMQNSKKDNMAANSASPLPTTTNVAASATPVATAVTPTSTSTSPVINPSTATAAAPIKSATDIPSATPVPTPSASDTPVALDAKITDKTWVFIDSALKDIAKYYNNPTVTQSLVSNGGLLYNININNKVASSRVFAASAYKDFKLQNGYILFVYPKDLAIYSGLRIIDKGNLELFYAYRTSQGYAISSSTSGGGIITAAQFNELMDKYVASHGQIKELHSGSADFMELEYMALKEMNTKATQVDTRYLYSDGNYAVIVTSPRGTPADVHCYVFDKKDGKWEVAVKDFQNTAHYQKVINQKYPLMNVDLFPKYDVSNYSKSDYITNMTGILSGMEKGNFITQADLPLIYGVGAVNSFYFEFTSGKAFVGYASKDGLKIYPVKDTDESNSVLKGLSDNPPYIILKQY